MTNDYKDCFLITTSERGKQMSISVSRFPLVMAHATAESASLSLHGTATELFRAVIDPSMLLRLFEGDETDEEQVSTYYVVPSFEDLRIHTRQIFMRLYAPGVAEEDIDGRDQEEIDESTGYIMTEVEAALAADEVRQRRRRH